MSFTSGHRTAECDHSYRNAWGYYEVSGTGRGAAIGACVWSLENHKAPGLGSWNSSAAELLALSSVHEEYFLDIIRDFNNYNKI